MNWIGYFVPRRPILKNKKLGHKRFPNWYYISYAPLAMFNRTIVESILLVSQQDLLLWLFLAIYPVLVLMLEPVLDKRFHLMLVVVFSYVFTPSIMFNCSTMITLYLFITYSSTTSIASISLFYFHHYHHCCYHSSSIIAHSPSNTTIFLGHLYSVSISS